MRTAIRTLRKTTRALALVLAVSACQNAGLAPIAAPTKPAEPPPPVAAPPTAVTTEELTAPVAPTRADGAQAALLVPLSGPSAAVGQHLWNAAQLAVFDVGGPGFTVRPVDTRGTPEGAAAAAQQAIAQGADIILGPLFSAEVKAVSPLARQAGVPVVAFTTDASAAGDGTFILGVLPRSQVARVVGHARTQGIGRFAVLAPDDEYGRTMAEVLQEVVRDGGGLLTRAEFYDPRATDPSAAIRRLGGGGGPAPFEALLLPDQGVRLQTAAAMLGANGVDTARVQLLGTALWGNGGAGQEPALLGGWYPAPPQAVHADFAANYQRNFNTPAPPIASLGYDATALAAVLAQRPGAGFDMASLTNPAGFAGIDGIFRLLPDGTNQRGLAVMALTREGASEISPAPASFADRVY